MKDVTHNTYGKFSLLWALAVRDFKGKYAASFMGVFWSVLNPLLLLAVFTFIFTAVFKIRLGASPGFAHNALYIFCGIVPWIALQEAVQKSTTVLIEQKNLVTRVRFPSEVLPAAAVVSSFLGMSAALAILLGATKFTTGSIPITIILLPFVLALQLIFTLGVAWLVSSVNVFFRDLQQLMPTVLLVWMYGTPIFYSPEMLPEKVKLCGDVAIGVKAAMYLNPMYHFVAAYRAIVLDGQTPDAINILYMLFFAAAFYWLGRESFRRGSRKFADIL